jgi:hypothetical protein
MHKKFRIGDIVEVTNLVSIEKTNTERFLVEQNPPNKPYYMYYVGYTHLRTGKIVDGMEDEQNFITDIKAHKVAKLVFSQNGKIHYSPFDSIKIKLVIDYNFVGKPATILKEYKPESFVNFGGWKSITEAEKKDILKDLNDWRCKLCGRFISNRNVCPKCGDLNASNT